SGSMSRPPQLNGSNYSYSKSEMTIFFRSLGKGVWESVENGWEYPVIPQAPDQGKETTTNVTVSKPTDNWTDAEKLQEEASYRALYAIMMAVDQTRHKMIVHCKTAKDACRILQRQFEGSTAVKASRLQRVTLEFDEIKMRDEETIDVYYARFCDLVNQSMMLGEEISEKCQVQKIMRTVVPRFREKITALESFQLVASLDVDELLGELRTFEINNNYDKVMSKGLALKAAVVEEREESDDDEGPLADDSELKETLDLIARNYEKMSQRLYKNKFAGKKGNSFSKNVVQDKKSTMPLSKCDSQRVEKDQCREFRSWNQSGIQVKVHSRILPNNRTKTHQVWVATKSFNCFASVLSLRTSLEGKWYLDSRFCRHMIGEPSYLKNIQPSSNGEVTFGDRVSNKVIGTGCLNLGGIPKLTDVLLVDKLKENLLSVSQLCDQGLSVSFSCDKCYVKDSEGSC
ncbi:Unknown protein, partial [Striga hermonthica]